LFTLHAALQQGEVVTVLCDRHPGSPKCLTCDFLNGKADFPAGAFALADTLGVEVLSVFVIKESVKKYTVHIKPLSLDAQQAEGGKNERVAACVRAFVSEAEAIVRRYPEQWFNYYEFWKE
jgi:predicted LPLAT superfamily acyltransferase